MYTYCIYCQTIRCNQIASCLQGEEFILDAIYPKIIQRQRKKKKNHEIESDFLPGYIFLYSERDLIDSIIEISKKYGVIRLLGNSDNNYALIGEDYLFAINLYKQNGVIGDVSLKKTHDKLMIYDPMFVQMNAEVSKIDYKKGRAKIEFDFAG